jgi:cob(I)alamin adenosyltransferase
MQSGSIATRTGDKGDTGLLYGGRVRKTDARVDAYGAGDEAVSALGMARALCRDENVKSHILDLQKTMFTVNAELATASDSRHLLEKHFPTVSEAMTSELDSLLETLEAKVELPKSFVIPGGSAGSGAIDLARTIVRRTERAAVALVDDGELANAEVPRYLNRLSDVLFMLARYEDRELPLEPYTSVGSAD